MTDDERAEMVEAVARRLLVEHGYSSADLEHLRPDERGDFVRNARAAVSALAPLIAARERAAAEATRETIVSLVEAEQRRHGGWSEADYAAHDTCERILFDISELPLPGTKSAEKEPQE